MTMYVNGLWICCVWGIETRLDSGREGISSPELLDGAASRLCPDALAMTICDNLGPVDTQSSLSSMRLPLAVSWLGTCEIQKKHEIEGR